MRVGGWGEFDGEDELEGEWRRGERGLNTVGSRRIVRREMVTIVGRETIDGKGKQTLRGSEEGAIKKGVNEEYLRGWGEPCRGG
jgi:hypothetical protein